MSTSTNPIEEFVTNFQRVLATDYGDFKRKTGDYLNRLEDQMPQARPKIAQMKHYLLYEGNSSIEEIYQRILNDVEKLHKS